MFKLKGCSLSYWFDRFRNRKKTRREQYEAAAKAVFGHLEASDGVATGTAEGVAEYLDKTRLNFAYWMCVLSGILFSLGGPTLVKVIHDTDKNSSLLPWVWCGILLTGISFFLGVTSCALFYLATVSNPYYHFLWGYGKGALDNLCSTQREREVAVIQLRHSSSLIRSRKALLIQVLFFSMGALVVFVSTQVYLWSYL